MGLAKVLQKLKRRATSIVECHDLAVEDEAPGRDSGQSVRDNLEVARNLPMPARIESDLACGFHGNSPVTVPFDFKKPSVARRWMAHEQRLHGTDVSRRLAWEPGQFRRKAEASRIRLLFSRLGISSDFGFRVS